LVAAVDEALHVGDALGLPVAGEGVAAAGVHGLPAVVDDDGVEAHALGGGHLVEQHLGVQALVVVVPGRVHGQAGRLGHAGGGVVGLLGPPVRDAGQRGVVG